MKKTVKVIYQNYSLVHLKNYFQNFLLLETLQQLRRGMDEAVPFETSREEGVHG